MPEMEAKLMKWAEDNLPEGRRLFVQRVLTSKSKAENLNHVIPHLVAADRPFTAVYDADHHPDPRSLQMAIAHLSEVKGDCVQGSTYVREGFWLFVDSAGSAWSSSTPTTVLKAQAPASVQSLFEEHLHDAGWVFMSLPSSLPPSQISRRQRPLDSWGGSMRDLPLNGPVSEEGAARSIEYVLSAYLGYATRSTRSSSLATTPLESARPISTSRLPSRWRSGIYRFIP